MKIIKCLLLLSFLVTSLAMTAATPDEILKKATDKVNSAKGITGAFNINGNGQTLSGKLYVAGSRFHISTPSYSVWYNGKNMWSYNSSSKETTLIQPTSSELQETNPLEYMKTYSKEFSAKFAAKKSTGKYIIDLTPISRRSSMKNVQITLNSVSLKPEKFVITAKNNSITIISVRSLEYNSSLKPGIFEYPKNKYPKVEIIDLR